MRSSHQNIEDRLLNYSIRTSDEEEMNKRSKEEKKGKHTASAAGALLVRRWSSPALWEDAASGFKNDGVPLVRHWWIHWSTLSSAVEMMRVPSRALVKPLVSLVFSDERLLFIMSRWMIYLGFSQLLDLGSPKGHI